MGKRSKQRFVELGARALQVYVLSLEGLPHRQDPEDVPQRHRENFVVRVEWPCAPFFGPNELLPMEAYVWGTPRVHRPKERRGAYVYVDQTLRLPWVANQRLVLLSVWATELMSENLVGEVE